MNSDWMEGKTDGQSAIFILHPQVSGRGGEGAILLCICHYPEVDDVWLIMNQNI